MMMKFRAASSRAALVRVVSTTIDPKSYQAVLKLSLDRSIQLTGDTAAAITSEGLIGGNYIALQPGGDPKIPVEIDCTLERE